MTQLLQELDGSRHRGHVVILAATNRVDALDKALLRPGRFDLLLHVGPPRLHDREDTLRVLLRSCPLGDDVSLAVRGKMGRNVCVGALCSLVFVAHVFGNCVVQEQQRVHIVRSTIGCYRRRLANQFQSTSIKGGGCHTATEPHKYSPCKQYVACVAAGWVFSTFGLPALDGRVVGAPCEPLLMSPPMWLWVCERNSANPVVPLEQSHARDEGYKKRDGTFWESK